MHTMRTLLAGLLPIMKYLERFIWSCSDLIEIVCIVVIFFCRGK